jgi:hypothetical protein
MLISHGNSNSPDNSSSIKLTGRKFRELISSGAIRRKMGAYTEILSLLSEYLE